MAVRFKKNTTNSFFGHFLYEQLLDKKHFLVQAKQIVDWNKFTQKCLRWYKGAGEVGRPPYNPSCLLKMLFISYLYNFSERQTEMMVNDSIAMKYFLGLGVDEKAPDHSSLTYFKERLLKGAGQSAYDQLLREILSQAKEKGIEFGSIQIIDSVHTIADVNTDKDQAAANKSDSGSNSMSKSGDNERNNNNQSKSGKDNKPRRPTPRDPDAKWGAKHQRKVKDYQTGEVHKQTEYFYGYKAHMSRNQNGLVTSCKSTAGNAYDGHHLKALVGKDRFTPIPKKRTYTADRGYDDGDNHEYLKVKKLSDAIKLNRYRAHKKDANKEPWLALRQTEDYRAGLKERYKIEQTFGQMKQGHGLRRARYLGLDKYHVQATITALVYNLKVVVAHITRSTLKGYGYKGNTVWFHAASP